MKIQSKTKLNHKGEQSEVGYINLLQDGYLTIDNLEYGDYVLTMYVQCDSIGNISVGEQSQDITTSWDKVSFILSNVENIINIKFKKGVYYIYEAKLEKGNKATAWTPAPEDTEEKITELNTKYTEVKQTTDGLSVTVASHTTQIASKADNSTVTTVSNKVTSLEQNLTGFKTTVSDTYATKTALNTVDGKFSNYSTTAQMNSAIQQKADSITSTVSSTYATKTEFNGLQVGGRNLLLNSADLTKWTPESGTTVKADTDGYFKISTTRNSGWWSTEQDITLDAGSYTVSGYFKAGTKKGVFIIRRFDNNAEIVVKSDVLGYFKHSFTISETTNARVHIGLSPTASGDYVYAKLFKLEKGNKATDWTPAPEDVDSAINTVNTIATQTANKFNWLVKSGTSETDFTLTDRTATLVSDYINLNGLVTFNGLDRNTQTEIEKAQGIINNIYTTNTTTIDGGKITTGSITADKINVADLFAQDITATNISIEGGRIGGFEITENKLSVLDPNDEYKYVGSFYTGTQRGVAGGLYGNISISAPFVNIYSTDSDFEFGGNVNINGVEISNDPNTGTSISTDNIYVDGRTVVKSYGNGTATHIIDRMTHVYDAQYNYMSFYTAKGAFGVTAWVSDTKLKKNIIETEINALDKINQINMVQFDWKRGGHVDLGVSANQLSEIIPDAVFEVEQEENSEFDSLKNVNPSVLISYCIKAIQELSEENKKLKKEV